MAQSDPLTISANGRSRWIGAIRLAIGLAQGLAIHLLARRIGDSSGDSSLWLTAWFVLALLLPFPALAGPGVLPVGTLVIWLASAGAVLFGLGAYLGFVYPDLSNASPGIFLLSLALFIAHHLLVASAGAGRVLAPYGDYFDRAWKSVLQMALATGFALAAWLLLWLAAGLFAVLGFHGLGKLLGEAAFSTPFLFTMFAAAVHLTDQRAELVLGARNLGLSLLGWLTPPMAALTLVFFVLLFPGGVGRLWGEGPGSGLLIAAAIVLIVLVNCLYQDGSRAPGRILGWSGRAAAALIAPLVALALVGIWLRIADLGWTRTRIFVVAILVTLAIYGATYLWAARPGGKGFLPGLGTHNVRVAWLATAILLVLVSPLGDPARLAVADQMQRLRSGKTLPEAFDFRFLAQAEDSGRWGKAALNELAALSGDARAMTIAAKARDALAERVADEAVKRNVDAPPPEMTPAGRRLRIRNLTGDPAVPDGALGPFSGGDDPAQDCAEIAGSTSTNKFSSRPVCQLRRLDLVTTLDEELVLMIGGEVSIVFPGETPQSPWRWVILGCCLADADLAADVVGVVDLPIRGIRGMGGEFRFNFGQPEIDLLNPPPGKPAPAPAK